VAIPPSPSWEKSAGGERFSGLEARTPGFSRNERATRPWPRGSRLGPFAESSGSLPADRGNLPAERPRSEIRLGGGQQADFETLSSHLLSTRPTRSLPIRAGGSSSLVRVNVRTLYHSMHDPLQSASNAE
ncbi:hypothetical protein K0M31_019187, partial [Melipona bicolor]